MLDHAAKIRLEKHYGLILVTLVEGDKKTGLYVKAAGKNVEEILGMKNLNREEVERLGEVIASFEGDSPPEDVKDYINSLLL